MQISERIDQTKKYVQISPSGKILLNIVSSESGFKAIFDIQK